jgi:hypothetical protein
MIPVTQTLFGKAEGNCLAACVASILELDLADVPTICADQSDGSWLRKLADWLAEQGMCAVHASFVDGDPGVVPAPEDLATMRAWMKLRRIGFAIVSGYTTRGLSHSTVWFDGEIVHDPHPSKDPLINVVDMVVIAHRDPRALWHEHVTETAGLISNAAAVREQHSNRVERLLGRIETLEAEVAQLRARSRVEAVEHLRKYPRARIECRDPSEPIDCGSWQACWLDSDLLVRVSPDGNEPSPVVVPSGFAFRVNPGVG